METGAGLALAPQVNDIVPVAVTKVARTFLLAVMDQKRGYVFVHASQIYERSLGNLEDFFKPGQPIFVKLVEYDQRHGRWTGSYKAANKINVTERSKPNPTPGGSKRVIELTMQKAERVAARQKPNRTTNPQG